MRPGSIPSARSSAAAGTAGSPASRYSQLAFDYYVLVGISGLVHGYASFSAVSAAARDATLDAASALRAALALVEARTSARRRPSSVAG